MTFQYSKKLPAELTRAAALLHKCTVTRMYYHHYFILFLWRTFCTSVGSVFINFVEYNIYCLQNFKLSTY
jgi:hypothetical protein